MRAGTDSRGYTILEVMIFLAISGFMFVLAAGFVSGKQSRSEFRQGMNDINTQVQQVINDVSNGFYPSNNTFTCKDIGAGSAPQLSAGSSGTQGSNQGCIFLGKVIQFGVSGSNGLDYNTFTVAGRQYKISSSDGTLVTLLAEAKPTAVCGVTPATCPDASFDLTDRKTLQWGTRVTKIFSASIPAISAVGFFGSLGSYNNTSGELQSGSQNVAVVPLDGALNQTEAQLAQKIATITDASIDNNPNITICLEGGGSQFGTLNIGGGNGQRLTTSINISNTKATGC